MADIEEMTLSEYDVLVFKERQSAAQRKHERSLNRWRQGATAVGFMAAAATILGIAFIIWQGVAGPSAVEELRDRQQSDCIASRGTWIPIVASETRHEYTCIFAVEK